MVTYSREVLAADGGAGVLATKVQGAGYGASVVSDKPLSSSAGSESLFLVSFADDAGVGVGVDWDANACFEMIKTAVSSKRGVMSVYRKDAAAQPPPSIQPLLLPSFPRRHPAPLRPATHTQTPRRRAAARTSTLLRPRPRPGNEERFYSSPSRSPTRTRPASQAPVTWWNAAPRLG